MVFQESESVELKSVVVDDIKKEIVAFANCNGGKLYIGVNDDGTVRGLDDPDSVALQVSNMVRDAIKPDVTMFLRYETIKTEGKYILSIDIHRGTERPYYIAKKGLRPEGVYVRQGYSSVPATDNAIRSMIRDTDGNCFEEMRSLEQDLTFSAAEKEFAGRNITFKPTQMRTLGVINHDDVYTNLGLLLSDQCAHTIKAAVFQGTGQKVFKDRREFRGSLFRQMEKAYDYIDLHNRTRSTFDKLRRIDIRDYPQVAVREALLNCIVHREYSFGDSSLISIYDDRIEFTSIGGLVADLTLDDIMLGISVCRNPKLANVFYRLELIEAYGTGMRKIIEAYEESNQKPKMEISNNAFKIVLPNVNHPADNIDAKQTNSPPSDPAEKILGFIQEQGGATRKEIENLLGLSQSTSIRLLKNLVEKEYITREGRGRNTRYIKGPRSSI